MTKSKAVQIIKDSTELSKLVKALNTAGATQDSRYHIACISALAHGFEHKSTGHAQNLLDGAGGMVRKAAIKNYLMDLGCFEFKLDDEGKPTKTLGINKDKHALGFVHLAIAQEKSPSKYSAEPEAVSPMNTMAELRKLIDKLTKAKGKGLLDAESTSVLDMLTHVAPSAVSADNSVQASAKSMAEEI